MTGDAGVVLAAAGTGSRFGAKKQLLELRGRPILHYSLDVFASLDSVARIIVVMPQEDQETGRRLVDAWLAERRFMAPSAESSRGEESRLRRPEIEVIAGGVRRQDSVLNGLRALLGRVRIALVHDAARPLVKPGEAQRVFEAACEEGAAVIGTPTADSVKRAKALRIVEALPRDEIWTVQTPQAATVELLIQAYERGGERELTDEASALELLGARVTLVEGSRENLKITRQEDLGMAESILRQREEAASSGPARSTQQRNALQWSTMFRAGLGVDNHRLVEGRKLLLGGVEIPSPVGEDAHSDGDVLVHALCDALYGAIARGDIGEHFPDSDPRWKGQASIYFLQHALGLVKEAGYRVVNVDATVFLEKIRLSPHKLRIAESLRLAMEPFWQVAVQAVNIKAKTWERCDSVGRGEAVAAQVLVLLERERP